MIHKISDVQHVLINEHEMFCLVKKLLSKVSLNISGITGSLLGLRGGGGIRWET